MALGSSYGTSYGVRRRTPAGTSGNAIPAETIERNLRLPSGNYEAQQEAHGTGVPVSEQRAQALVSAGYTSGQSVANYQKFLAARGLYHGRIDGVWGPATEAAQKAYRQWAANNQYRQQEEFEANAAKAAAAARAQILQMSKEAAALFGAKAAGEFAKYADGNRYGNQAAIIAAKQIQSQLSAARSKRAALEQKKNSGWANKLKNAVSGGLRAFNPGFELLGRGQEEIAQSYYASKRAQLTGGSLFDQLGAGVAGLPGLGGVAARGSAARRAIEETNSRRERQVLTEKGQLASFGELLSGRAYGKLKGPALAQYQKTGANHLPGAASPALDAAFNVATDPLSYVGGALRAGGLYDPIERAGAAALRRAGLSLGSEAGQKASLAAKLNYLRSSTVGKRLVDGVERLAAKAVDAKQLERSVKNLSYDTAEQILKSPQAERRAVIEKAMALGEHDVKLSLRKQALIKATNGRFGTGEIVKDGLRAKGSEVLRSIARGKEIRGTLAPTKKAGLALEHSVESALLRIGKGEVVDDFIRRVVRPATQGLSISERIGRVWAAAERSGSAALIDLAERQVKGLIAEARKAGVSADALMNATDFVPKLIGDDIEKAGLKASAAKAADMLEKLEAAAAVLAGEAGDSGALQATADLAEGVLSKNKDIYAAVQRAGENVGLSLPRATGLKYSDKEARLLRAEIQTAIRDVDDDLADRLLSDLDRATAKRSSLGRLRKTIDALKKNPELLDEAARLAGNESLLAEQRVVEEAVPGLARRALGKVASVPLAFAEARYADSVSFEGKTANDIMRASDRVEQADRWFMGLGLDDFSRGRLRSAVAGATSEQEMYDLFESVAERQGQRMGLERGTVIEIMREARAALHTKKMTFILPDGEAADNVYTLAQLNEMIPMVDPTDLRKAMTLVKAERGNVLSRARTHVDEFGNRQIGTLTSKGSPLTVRRILRKGHTEWKFLIVTNLYQAPIGFAGGYIGSDDKSTLGRLRSAATWGLVGAVTSPVRYLSRVPGIEEKLRKFLDLGANNEAWIPVLAKRMRRKGGLDPEEMGLMSRELLGSGADVEFMRRGNQHLVTVDKGYEKLGRNDKRYVDGWARIVNRQFHVETDVVAEALLKEKAGLATRAETDIALEQFLKTTEGKTFLKRMKSGSGNAGKKSSEILDQYRAFADAHFDDSLARARLAGEVKHETLVEATKAGRGPELIHAQKTWIAPRSVREAFALRNRLASKYILEGPTLHSNRIPMAETIFKERFTTMVNNGVDPERARFLADEFAIKRTNEVMFNINDESRFAARADVFTPFQQPREEMVRVWGKLVARNPGRSMIVAENAAKAFNAGVSNGMFKKDAFTGEWTLNTPGAGQVSAILGNSIGLHSNLRDYLFFGQGAYNIGFLPTPGGPYWTAASRLFLDSDWGKEFVEEQLPESFRKLMFPYGSDGQIYARQGNRLWMALTYSTPPWEFFAKHDLENTLNKTEGAVFKELLSQYFKEHNSYPEDLDAFVTNEVIPSTKALLKSWAVMSSLSASAPRPFWAGQEEYQKVRNIYTDSTGHTDIKAMEAHHPWTKVYIDAGRSTTPVDNSFDAWMKGVEGQDPDIARLLRQYKYKGAREYASIIKEARERSIAMEAMFAAQKNPNPLEREEQLAQWRADNPELAKKLRSTYAAKKELSVILTSYPRGQVQDRALDQWRTHYDVSPGKFRYWKSDIETGRFRTNPWAEAREMEEVYADVRKQMRRGFNEDAYVATLQPVEQLRYWNQKLIDLNIDALGVQSKPAWQKIDEYRLLSSKRAQVWQLHPFLGGLPKPQPPMERAIAKWQGDYRQAINDLWTKINAVDATMKQAAAAKNWALYYKLKPQFQSLHDARLALTNKMYHEMPEFPGLQEELRANMVFGKFKGAEGDFIHSNEEAAFLRMPDGIRGAYIQDLVDRMEPDWKDPNGFDPGHGRMFWERLTDFQRDLLEKNLPKDDLDYLKTFTPENSKSSGGGGGGRGFSAQSNEMGFAIQAFKDWNRRPAGAKAPAAYAEYLKLPNDSVVRSEFIKSHPEVRDWLKLGPMANMPPVLKYIVANIMVKYGKWEGEQRDYAAIADLSFAQEQLSRFNLRRDKTKPQAYDVWVNMPTGTEKAAFLAQHPEVGEWIRLGPMANMPEEYQDVVRDIMTRYGEWTEKEDPLGKVVQGFYKLPQRARDQYLKDHPELSAYWAATRSAEENAQFALADQYFAIQDQGAKRFFLMSHPELQDWFISQRTKRYERFLNRVAVYMGSNPELFEHYLKRQEDILGELLNRYADSPLLREIRPQAAPKVSSTETGRKRAVAA